MNLEALVLPLEIADKTFNKGLAVAAAGVAALVGAVGAAIKTTFDWANELDSIGDVMDVTTGQAAAFGYVARKSGVATETFTKGVVILSKGLVKADGSLDTTGKSLEAWGISVKDVNGKLKSQTALIGDVSKKYGTFATQQEKVNFLTEVFGKSGAEMIDFFDVLASEGGIDAVTQKVTAMGLAIDPARYENFTRNLEELKLIGTGLAVTFTEKLMPGLEAILDWVTRFAGANPAEKLSMLADPLKILFNLTDAFKQGVEGTDWAGLSQQIADKVNSIDWNLVGQYIRLGISNVLQGIGTVIQEIDWQVLANSFGQAIAAIVAGLFGYPDWNALGEDFKEGLGVAFEAIKAFALQQMMNLGEIIFNAIVADLAPVEQRLSAIFDTIKAKWQELLNFISSVTGIQLPSSQTSKNGGGATWGSSGGAVQGKGGNRASGGAVIAGQQYNVAEFYKPETFTPSVNGRIDPMNGGGASDIVNAILNSRMSEEKLARLFVIGIKQAGLANG